MIKKSFYLLVVISILCGCFSFTWGADKGEIFSGETKTGIISTEGQTDSFWFYGQQGQGVVIEMATTEGNLDPEIGLYRPDGTQEVEAYDLGNRVRIEDHQLEQTGIYTIVAAGYFTDPTGSYGLSLVLIPGATSSAQDPDGGDIASGQTYTGTISPGGDTDIFAFYGQQGQGVVIEMATTEGNLDPEIGLYRPDGTQEVEAYDLGNRVRIEDHQLEQTGIYTIVAAGYFTDPTGSYGLSFTLIPPIPPPGIYNPSPQNGATIYDLDGSFSWDSVEGATGYDLYFGEDVIEPLEKIGSNLPFPSMDFPEMERGKVYYWHVVANTLDGDIEGPYWWFLVSIEGMPIPDIKANGSDDPLFVTPSESVDISISLDPGDMAGEWADWWGFLLSSYGTFPLFGFQYPLFELPDTSLFSRSWPVGWYIFLFGLDDVPDGVFELD
jgi:hypothetical protein